jgi:hypothetical protein
VDGASRRPLLALKQNLLTSSIVLRRLLSAAYNCKFMIPA